MNSCRAETLFPCHYELQNFQYYLSFSTDLELTTINWNRIVSNNSLEVWLQCSLTAAVPCSDPATWLEPWTATSAPWLSTSWPATGSWPGRRSPGWATSTGSRPTTWGRDGSMERLATATGNVDLKVSEINVGSSYEFFQTSDRDSRVLLNKDSFHIVGWRNVDSSIYCNTFNFWRTPWIQYRYDLKF